MNRRCVAHIVLFVMYIAEIGYLAHRYGDPNLEHEFNVAGFMTDPTETLYQGLILAFKPAVGIALLTQMRSDFEKIGR